MKKFIEFCRMLGGAIGLACTYTKEDECSACPDCGSQYCQFCDLFEG